jgi:hypothetical protein
VFDLVDLGFGLVLDLVNYNFDIMVDLSGLGSNPGLKLK